MINREPQTASAYNFLAGGGQMGERIRHFDWSQTALGPIENWPQSLKTSVSLMLNSQHPMWIGWGPQAAFLYNDAYIEVLSLAKHPWALGKPAAEVWAEIWDVCGPLADKVFQHAEASFLNDVRLFMSRGSFLEETFYSFSYSPIWDEAGNVGGLFCPSTEVTAKVLNTRRLGTISELAAEALVEKSTAGACASAAAILAKNADDIPFALLYLVDSTGETAFLEQAVRLSFGDHTLSPAWVNLKDSEEGPTLWPIREVMAEVRSQVVGLAGRPGFPLGAADQHLAEALVLPLVSREQERPLGILVAGVNPTRKLDLEYRAFFELIAGHLTTAIQNARATEDEKHRADMLAELDRAKTTFFSNVSHELRTPLTLILGPLEDEIRERAVPSERLQLAHRNALRLLKLVNTLLDFSRLEAGRLEAVFEPVDLASHTTELAGVFRDGMERAGLRFHVDCPPLSEPAYVDRDLWEKIVFNLLSNAFKFTLQGEIELKLRETQNIAGDGQNAAKFFTLSVRDTGTGIPAAELPRIFERFHRVRNPASRSHEGTGIGLALVQELAHLHAGEVNVESQEGRGSLFTVAIPAGRAHLPADRIGASRTLPASNIGAQAFVAESLRWLPPLAAEPEDSLPPEPKNIEKHKKSRIVLADDNSDMREYIRSLLVSRGYEVTTVGDGRAALEAIRADPPALVLSDVMMPHLGGFELLRELRNAPETRSIPIILISARAGEESRIEGIEAGADDYLTKPFSGRELLARVTTHLELVRVRQEAEAAIREREAKLRAALQARAESEERFRNIFVHAATGIAITTPQGLFERCNPAYGALLGYTEEELRHIPLSALVHPEDWGKNQAALEHLLTGTIPFFEIENRYLRKDGTPVWVHKLVSLLHDETGQGAHFVALVTDVTGRRRTEAALQAAKDAAEAANRSKDHFLAALSHELRTPLTPVLMTAATLMEDQRLPLDVREQLNMMERNISLEARLIDDLLDITAISRGKLLLRKQLCDAHSLIELALGIVKDEALTREISIQREYAARRSGLMVDPARFQQVIWNLLRNAVKFTPRAGRIAIQTADRTNASGQPVLHIEISDSGIGIEPDALEKIFRPFEQGAAAGDHRFGGMGLGLAIARAIMDLHGGQILAQSQGVNYGATFVMELPDPTEPPPGLPESAATTSPASENGTAVVPAPEPEKKMWRLLLVEDHAATLHLIGTLLKRSGYHVATASTVADALKTAAAEKFDIVISDLGLPDGTGIQLMEKLRALYGLRGIALTGYGMDSDIARTRAAGFVAHLVKPVHIADLMKILATWE